MLYTCLHYLGYKDFIELLYKTLSAWTLKCLLHEKKSGFESMVLEDTSTVVF